MKTKVKKRSSKRCISSKNSITLKCNKGSQHGKDVFYVFMNPCHLNNFVDVDRMQKKEIGIDKGTPKWKGYQRTVKSKDLYQVALHVMNYDNILPNSIWLNDRNKTVRVEEKRGQVFLHFDKKYSKLFCPDGQTRAYGIIKAWSEFNSGNEKDSSLDDFSVPVIITRLSKEDERKGFLSINDNAKKVGTPHKSSIKWQIVCEGDEHKLNDEDKTYAIAYGITETLDEQNCSLKDVIILPGKDKYLLRETKADPSKRNKRKVNAGSFVHSFVKTGLISFMTKEVYPEESAKVQSIKISEELKKYWDAIFELTSPMWEDVKSYSLLSAIGTMAMGDLFVKIRKDMIKNKQKVSKDVFLGYLSNSKFLQDYKKWLNTVGIKRYSISSSSAKHTMADKRGTSYGIIVSRHIFKEISQNMQKTKVAKKSKSKK